MLRSNKFDRSMNAREVALRSLMAGGDAAASLERVLADATLDARERAFATELAHGTRKRQRTLEWSLQTCLKKPFGKLDPLLQSILLLGAYQILFLQRVPAHAAVDESVTLARRMGHAGLAATANAVLRRLSRERPLPPEPTREGGARGLGLYASLPDWIAQALIDRYGFDTAVDIAAGLNAPPRRALRVDSTKWSVEDARTALAHAGFEIATGEYGLPESIVITNAARGDRAFLKASIAAGRLTLQSEESQLAVHILDPQRGETILDVCAGRGTKTGAIASRLSGEGTVVAIDDDAAKLNVLKASAQRFATPVRIVRTDARKEYPAGMPRNADAVLVDAPCSGLGVIGRRADARWQKRPDDPKRFARVQRDILARAAAHVRPGGRLLYVSCSISPIENEGVVRAFLTDNPQWRGRHCHIPGASAVTHTDGALLTTPGIKGSDGFFYSLLERSGQ